MTCVCGKYDQCKQQKDYVPTNLHSPSTCPKCGACAYSNMNCITASPEYLRCINCNTLRAFDPAVAATLQSQSGAAGHEPKPRPRIADDVEAIRAAAAARGIRI